MLNLPPADRLLDIPDDCFAESVEQFVPQTEVAVVLPPPSRNGDSHAEYIPSSEEPDWEQSTTHKPDKLPPIVDAVEFIAVELPTPPELIKGLLHQGTKMMLGGGSKSFKTWLQMDMAISVASGQPWMGCEVERGKVLFANLELHDSFFHKRLIAICQARGIKLEKGMLDLWNLRGFSASYDVIIPEVIRRTAEKRYVLDFFDPIYKIYGKTDENSAGEVAQLVNSLETLCVQTQACVAFGAHFSKGNQSQKEAIDRTSGSGVWSRDPDTILTFTRHEEEDCFTVESNLRNLPSMPPFVVRWKYPLMVRDDTLDPEKLKQIGGPGKRKEHDPIELLGWIKHTTPVNAMNRSAWAAASGIKDKTLSDYIAEFRSMGYIRTVGEGRFAAYHITEKGLRFINSPL